MAKAFTRGGYSFRPKSYRQGDPVDYWAVHRIGDRSYERATIEPASDGQCWIVYAAQRRDARPSFKEACDLVMSRLPREG